MKTWLTSDLRIPRWLLLVMFLLVIVIFLLLETIIYDLHRENAGWSKLWAEQTCHGKFELAMPLCMINALDPPRIDALIVFPLAWVAVLCVLVIFVVCLWVLRRSKP